MHSKPRASTWHILTAYWSAIRRYLFVACGLWLSVVFAVAMTLIAPLYYKKFFDVLTGGAPAADMVRRLLGILVKILLLNAGAWAGWRSATFIHNFFESR